MGRAGTMGTLNCTTYRSFPSRDEAEAKLHAVLYFFGLAPDRHESAFRFVECNRCGGYHILARRSSETLGETDDAADDIN